MDGVIRTQRWRCCLLICWDLQTTLSAKLLFPNVLDASHRSPVCLCFRIMFVFKESSLLSYSSGKTDYDVETLDILKKKCIIVTHIVLDRYIPHSQVQGLFTSIDSELVERWRIYFFTAVTRTGILHWEKIHQKYAHIIYIIF